MDEAQNPSEWADEGEMMWETHAREAIERAASTIEKDEIRGVMYMDDGPDHDFHSRQREFESWEDVKIALTQIGESEWVNYAPFDGGEPVFGPSVEDYVSDAMSEHEVEEFFESVARPEEVEQLIEAHDLLGPRAGLIVRVDLEEINSELVKYLARHPEKM